MAKKKESRLQRKIRDALEKMFPNAFFWKCHGGPFQKAGLPDLIGCMSGRFVAIEVKVPGGSTSEVQDEVIEDLKAAGAYVTVAESIDEAVDFCRAIASSPSAGRGRLRLCETERRLAVPTAPREDVDNVRRSRKKKARTDADRKRARKH